MKKRIARLGSAVMAIAVLFSLSANAAELTTASDTANVPVTLTSGTEEIFSVTVPTSLPLSMSTRGRITTADDCKIINNSHAPVEVKSVTITAENGWSLAPHMTEHIWSEAETDSKTVSFMLQFGDGPEYCTDESSTEEQELISEPDKSCIMTSVDDTTANELKITYGAMVSPTSEAVTDAEIANVAFVIGWAD